MDMMFVTGATVSIDYIKGGIDEIRTNDTTLWLIIGLNKKGYSSPKACV